MFTSKWQYIQIIWITYFIYKMSMLSQSYSECEHYCSIKCKKYFDRCVCIFISIFKSYLFFGLKHKMSHTNLICIFGFAKSKERSKKLSNVHELQDQKIITKIIVFMFMSIDRHSLRMSSNIICALSICSSRKTNESTNVTRLWITIAFFSPFFLYCR